MVVSQSDCTKSELSKNNLNLTGRIQMNKNQDYLQSMIDGKLPVPPIADLIGIRLTNIANGSVTMEMDASEKHWNPMKTLHGGVLCDIADAAMGTSFFTTLDEGESYTTVDLSIKFLSPVIKGKIIAHGYVVRRGRHLGYMECELRDVNDNLVAKASSSCIIIKGTM
jgi:uncharacterized protein (TIGR00369 family)